MPTLEERQRAYEGQFHRLYGARLAEVRYFEIEYEGDFTGWSTASHVGHLLDFGLDLVMSDGSVFGFIWGADFFQYGVEFVRGSLRSQLNHYREVQASSHANWQPHLGHSISEIQVFWSWVDTHPAPHPEARIHYPQDLAIRFDTGLVVYVSASQYEAENDTLFGMSDNLVVIFSDKSARRYKIGPYAVDVSA